MYLQNGKFLTVGNFFMYLSNAVNTIWLMMTQKKMKTVIEAPGIAMTATQEHFITYSF